MSKNTSAQVVSRRSVLRAAAWAVPAVAVAVATPALAASGEAQNPIEDGGGGPVAGRPAPAPSRPVASPLTFTAENSWAYSNESGVVQAYTNMTIRAEGDPVNLPKGFTSLFYAVVVSDAAGQQVHYTEVTALIPEGNHGASPTQHLKVQGLAAGHYTVTWQILSATDSNGHVLSTAGPEQAFKRVTVEVTTW